MVTSTTPLVAFVPPEGDTIDSLRKSPWEEFLKEIERTHQLCDSDGLRDAPQALVTFRFDREVQAIIRNLRLDPSHCLLVINESDVILPNLYTTRCRMKFGHVWAPSVRLALEVAGTPYHWPQNLEGHGYGRPPESRITTPCMLLANKFSAVPSENFSLRRRVIAQAIRRGYSLDVIGHHWDLCQSRQVGQVLKHSVSVVTAGQVPKFWGQNFIKPRSRIANVRFLGSVNDKYCTLGKYDIAIVTENSLKWTTEKLFDAVSMGCVPIYVGASIEELGLPSNLCVQSEPYADAIWEHVRQLTPDRKEEIRNSGLSFLQSEQAHYLQNERVLRRLGESVNGVLRSL